MVFGVPPFGCFSGNGNVVERIRIPLLYWLPPLLLMAIIFYLSSLSGLPDFQSFDFAVKKAAHFTVYGVLYFLVFRAVHSIRPRADTVHSAVYGISAIVTVLYATSDEIHQAFVPFRNATARDVAIDSAGIVLMYLVLRIKPLLFVGFLRRPDR
jgi:VanZ family protein